MGLCHLESSREFRDVEAHLRDVNLKKLYPDPATLNHANKIGRTMIPDASSSADDAPLDRLAKGVGGVNLERGNLEGAEANLTRH